MPAPSYRFETVSMPEDISAQTLAVFAGGEEERLDGLSAGRAWMQKEAASQIDAKTAMRPLFLENSYVADDGKVKIQEALSKYVIATNTSLNYTSETGEAVTLHPQALYEDIQKKAGEDFVPKNGFNNVKEAVEEALTSLLKQTKDKNEDAKSALYDGAFVQDDAPARAFYLQYDAKNMTPEGEAPKTELQEMAASALGAKRGYPLKRFADGRLVHNAYEQIPGKEGESSLSVQGMIVASVGGQAGRSSIDGEPENFRYPNVSKAAPHLPALFAYVVTQHREKDANTSSLTFPSSVSAVLGGEFKQNHDAAMGAREHLTSTPVDVITYLAFSHPEKGTALARVGTNGVASEKVTWTDTEGKPMEQGSFPALKGFKEAFNAGACDAVRKFANHAYDAKGWKAYQAEPTVSWAEQQDARKENQAASLAV